MFERLKALDELAENKSQHGPNKEDRKNSKEEGIKGEGQNEKSETHTTDTFLTAENLVRDMASLMLSCEAKQNDAGIPVKQNDQVPHGAGSIQIADNTCENVGKGDDSSTAKVFENTINKKLSGVNYRHEVSGDVDKEHKHLKTHTTSHKTSHTTSQVVTEISFSEKGKSHLTEDLLKNPLPG